MGSAQRTHLHSQGSPSTRHEAQTDAHYACLKNPRPKPPSERRLAEAWDIVESWEREAEKWE